MAADQHSHGAHGGGGDHHGGAHHHILEESKAIKVLLILLVLTVFTVGISRVDFGALNFLIAMLVASIKAYFVGSIFMGLKYDKKENAVIFLTSFVFLAIFVAFSAADFYFRGDVFRKVKDPFFIASTGGPAKFKKPWEPRAELVAHGKGIFAIQCASCHGAEGTGNGPAAAGLNPKPRNFHASEGWKNGRKPSNIFKTLKEGVGGMPSFASLPAEDRWALSHYVHAFGGDGAPTDTGADLAAVGVDPSKDGAGADQDPRIPIDFAMERMTTQ